MDAFRPAQASRTSYRYDAFISYRHIEPDRKWAKWLHGALETYRVPKELVAKGFPRRLSRVFRDEEELPANADLSTQITAALDESKFLIVICSPRAVQSRWVNAEVEYFRKLGRHDRILALLIEGEPTESFPPALTQIRRSLTDSADQSREEFEEVEPLAADVRPDRTDESAATLRSHARLRLLACILGCRFDDLRQREAERRAKRGRLVGAGLMSLVVVLSLLTLFAFKQRTEAVSQRARAEEQTAKAEAQTKKALESEREAQRRRKIADQTVGVLESVLVSSDPSIGKSADTTIGDLLDDLQVRMKEEFDVEPQVRIRLMEILAHAYKTRGLDAKAKRVFEDVVSAYAASTGLLSDEEKQDDPRSSPEVRKANAMFELALFSDQEQRQSLLSSAIEIYDRFLEPGSSEAVTARNSQVFLGKATKLEDADKNTIVSQVALYMSLVERRPVLPAEVNSRVAELLLRSRQSWISGQREAAVKGIVDFVRPYAQFAAFQEQLPLFVATVGNTDFGVVDAEYMDDNLKEPVLLAAISLAEDTLSENHRVRFQLYDHYVGQMWERGRIGESTAYAQKLVKVSEAIHGRESAATVAAVILFAESLIASGRHRDAQQAVDGACQRLKDGSGVAHVAARLGACEVLKLLPKGLTVADKAATGVLPIHEAAFAGRVEAVRILLDLGVAVDTATPNGKTSLSFAAASNSLEVARLLIAYGADPLARHGKTGWTPAMEAAAENHVSTLSFLLEKSSLMQASDRGENLLHAAAGGNASDAVAFLLDRGLSIDEQDVDGETALMAAVWAGNEAFELLLERGASFLRRNKEEETVLHVAAASGNLAAVDKLLQLMRPEVAQSADTNGDTPLLRASYNGHVDVVRSLLRARHPAGPTLDNKWPPITAAAVKGHLEVCRELLKHGATPLDGRGKFRLPAAAALEGGHNDVVKLFLDEGFDVNTDMGDGSTLLHWAALWDKSEAIPMLLSRGANPLAMTQPGGKTALHIAAANGHASAAKALFEAAPQAAAIHDNEGMTPADRSRKNGWHELADELSASAVPRPATQP